MGFFDLLSGAGGLLSTAVQSDYDLIPGVDNPLNNTSGTTVNDVNANDALYYDTNSNGIKTTQVNGVASNEPYQEGQATLDGSGGSTYDAKAAQTADALRALADRETALRGLLGRAGTTRQTGMTKIGDEYNANKTTGLAGYDEQGILNTKDRLSNVDRVNQKAQTGYNSLRRILGLSGSANQSAKFGIGQAVSKVASQDRSGVFDTAGRNERGIELARNTFLTDLNRRKAEAEYNLEQDVYGQEQDIYGDLASVAAQRAQLQGGNYDAIQAAQAPYQAEITNRDNILASLFEKYRPTLNAVAERPELGKYSVDRAAIQANQQQPGDYSPYSQLLRRRLTESV